ncbi:unnamed protein product [Brassicogethes aeneus]|uniref:Uncharacterized protein n=1 Tax=Brassicogethes aeneus TaxID=1431903 RepID=A0A9P0FPC5_BRAAE|nr:unnamed protein product [Brassicogethes aeneus]
MSDHLMQNCISEEAERARYHIRDKYDNLNIELRNSTNDKVDETSLEKIIEWAEDIGDDDRVGARSTQAAELAERESALVASQAEDGLGSLGSGSDRLVGGILAARDKARYRKVGGQ